LQFQLVEDVASVVVAAAAAAERVAQTIARSEQPGCHARLTNHLAGIDEPGWL
jgi:hypothetical protein